MIRVRQHNFIWTIAFLGLVTGCNEQNDTPTVDQNPSSLQSSLPFQHYLPLGYLAFDLLIQDMNQDQKKDIVLVDHGKNQSQVLFQKDDGQFLGSPFSNALGFHPGNLIPWNPDEGLFVSGGEGTNTIRGLKWGGEVFDVVSAVSIRSPRFVEELHWPGWGRSVVSSPYSLDQIDILKGYDPLSGKGESHEMVPLAKNRPSIREPNRLTLADINNDGIEEVLMALRISKEIMVVRYPGSSLKKKIKKPVAEVLATNERWAMPNNIGVLDVDRKNGLDLLIPDEVMPGMLHILMNDGQGAFKEAPDIALPEQQGAIAIEAAVEETPDHRSRGLVVLSSIAGLTLYEVTEAGLAAPWRSWTIPNQRGRAAHRIEITDLDHDGEMDLVALYPKGLWVVEGPLVDRFEEMAVKGFRLSTD